MYMFAKSMTLVLLVLMIAGSLPLMSGSEGMEISGKTLYVGSGFEYETIQSAVDDAAPYDSINIYSGAYVEHVFADLDNLRVTGGGPGSVFIQGSLRVHGDHCVISGMTVQAIGENETTMGVGTKDTVYIKGNYTTVSDIFVSGSGDGEMDSGFHIEGEYLSVSRVNVTGADLGFYLESPDEDQVQRQNSFFTDCVAYNNTNNGFFLQCTKNIVFTGCSSIHNRIGFEHFVSWYILYDNCSAISNQRMGFGIHDSDNITILNSEASYNGEQGVHMTFNLAKPVKIVDSAFVHNGKDGVYLAPATKCSILRNMIFNNSERGIGIGDQGNQFADVDIIGNLIMNNSGPAVQIAVPKSSPETYGNDMIANGLVPFNGKQASGDSKTIWDDGSRGNHWSDWTSPDANSDGIVDNPYIMGSAKDRYPLVDRCTSLTVPKVWDHGTPGPFPDEGHDNGGDNSTPTENKAPSIVPFPLNASVGDYYTVTLKATDPDTPGNMLSWKISTNATWLEHVKNVIWGYPDKAGDFLLGVSVNDGKNTVIGNYTIQVAGDPNPAENDPPEIRTDVPAKERVLVGTDYKRQFTAFDLENDILTWSLETNASFLALSGATLSGTPDDDDLGIFLVKVTVSDGNGSDFVNYMLEVYDEDAGPIKTNPVDIRITNRGTGSPLFSLEDLSNGSVTFVKIEWYVDDVLTGNGTELNISLLEGKHEIRLKVTDDEGNVYEVTKDVGNEDPAPGKALSYVLAGFIVCIAIAMGAMLLVWKRMRSRKGIEKPVLAEEYVETVPSEVKSGRLDGIHMRSDLEIECDMMISDAYDSIARRMGSTIEE